MKVKAKKSFASGRFARAGDEFEVSEARARKLIALGFREPITRGGGQKTPPDAHSGSESPVKAKVEEQPTPARKTAKTRKSAAKATR